MESVNGWTSKEYMADCPYCGELVMLGENSTNCEINITVTCDHCDKEFIVKVIDD